MYMNNSCIGMCKLYTQEKKENVERNERERE